jgi:hypothetical protein
VTLRLRAIEVARSAADSPTLARILWRATFGTALTLSILWIADFYVWGDSGHLFVDAHVYFRATAAWVDGSNPWTTTFHDVPFAGIPPTLLLNVPFLPFGEDAAVAMWVVANTAAVAYIIRRLGLPLWVLLLQPVIEGWFAASPDLTLAGLMLLGGGWLAALTKPYAAPALLAERRWRQLAIAMAVLIASLPFLPWIEFYGSRDIIAGSFERFAGYPVSAAGSSVLIALVAISLVSLGWRRGWSLLTPGLLAQQPHYNLFFLQTIVRSRILAFAITLPLPHAAAIGVVSYAVVERLRPMARAPEDQLAVVATT